MNRRHGRSAFAATFLATLAMSLVEPQPQVDTTYAAAHNCSFWAAG